MVSPEDAETLCHHQQDHFYLGAFLIQSWLGGLLQRTAAEYAEKKNPRDRSLQTGESWQAFLDTFNRSTRRGYCYLLSSLFRFAGSDHSPANSLRRALVPLSIEHDCTGQYLGPKALKDLEQRWLAADAKRGKQKADAIAAEYSAVNDLGRKTIVRWCDWLDAAIHMRVHQLWHTSPACFDPDPQNRLLAALGAAEKHLARLDPKAQLAWAWDFAHAAESYKDSPKWALVGKAMSDKSDRRWDYAEVDRYVVALWPLVKAYNWTYRDLLSVIKPGLMRPESYPCASEQEFATYCSNVLALRKSAKGTTSKTGRPPGYDIAVRCCPGLAIRA